MGYSAAGRAVFLDGFAGAGVGQLLLVHQKRLAALATFAVEKNVGHSRDAMLAPTHRNLDTRRKKVRPEKQAGWESGKPAYKPDSVPLRAVTIPLAPPLLAESSDLPESPRLLGVGGPGRPSSPIWSCSAWGLPCRPGHPKRGALLPHLFTLTPAGRGGMFSVALSVSRALSETPWPLASTLPCGVRTFLCPREADSDHPAGLPETSIVSEHVSATDGQTQRQMIPKITRISRILRKPCCE